jgi:hypothetical protein
MDDEEVTCNACKRGDHDDCDGEDEYKARAEARECATKIQSLTEAEESLTGWWWAGKKWPLWNHEHS